MSEYGGCLDCLAGGFCESHGEDYWRGRAEGFAAGKEAAKRGVIAFLKDLENNHRLENYGVHAVVVSDAWRKIEMGEADEDIADEIRALTDVAT